MSGELLVINSDDGFGVVGGVDVYGHVLSIKYGKQYEFVFRFHRWL